MSPSDLDPQLGQAFSSALFEAMARASKGYLSCIDRARRILFLNRGVSRDVSDVVGKCMDDFIVPTHRSAVVAAVERAFRSGSVEELEYGVRLQDGEERRLRARIVPFRAAGDRELALILTEDVTDLWRTVQELERSVEFRHLVVEHLPDFVSMLDRDRRFVWVNRVAPGLTAEDVLGKPVEEFTSADSIPALRAAVAAAFESGTVGLFESEGYGDGTESAWYLVRVVPIRSDGGVKNVLLITSDITEQKRAEKALRKTEEQLHLAQRLEGLGQLAGGIAHDFNNLLQVIEGNLSFARKNLDSGKSAIDEIEQAREATKRAAELTSHLLAIGRRKRVDSKRVDLGVLVGQSVRMIRRAIPENIAIRYEPPAEPHCVELDAPQFDQVLLNLCVNARDAMPDGGALTIRVGSEGREQVLVTVSDTGHGILAENLPRVFEPFFTTKGTGSGLGLAVAAGIVAAHGGVVTAESDGKSGTTMTVRLPRVASCDDASRAAPVPAERGSGVILVVEDEDLVRTQVVRILSDAGYTVHEAETGTRALELARSHPRAINLALLDVVMPDLDGWQVFLELRELDPDIKVLFTTGYAADVLPPDFAARGARLLSKPYTPEVLLARVRELLSSRTLTA